MSYLGCAKCCTLFSITGIIFLVIMGSLLKSQPLYIRGPSDYNKASQGCYEGAMLYVVTLLLSVGYWMFDSLRVRPTTAPTTFLPSPVRTSPGRTSPTETNRFGGKYGAVVQDTF